MSENTDFRPQMVANLQGALMLETAYVGLVSGALQALATLSTATVEQLADRTGRDRGYLARWCDAAYGFELLEESQPDVFTLSDLGRRFLPDVADSFMPFAVQSILSAHMAERAAGLAASGDRPGEQVLGERDTLRPWFGPMLEANYAPLLEREILPGIEEFAEMDRRAGLAVDLGCGNGWYLRRMLQRFPRLRGIGLDTMAGNIEQATAAAQSERLDDRLEFRHGDLHDFAVDEPADLIAMNRALHHVWEQGTEVFDVLHRQLRPGGIAVIWEPNWPEARTQLRDPGFRPMAFQNLAEHVQGNHFLHPAQVRAEFELRGMTTKLYTFVGGREAVVVACR